jgi:hypothetical protein
MRLCCSLLLGILLFSAPMFGQVMRSSEEVFPSTALRTIAEQLREAKRATTRFKRRSALVRAQNLLLQLPKSPLKDGLKSKIEQVFRAGVFSEEAEEAIDEAIEIVRAADKILNQKPSPIDSETARATLLQVLNSPEFRVWNPIARFLQQISKWLEKPVNWVAKQLGVLLQWLGRVLRPVFELLSKIIEALGAWFWTWWQLLKTISPILAWSVLALFSAISLALLSYSILKWWRKRWRLQAEIAIAEVLIMPEQLLREAENAAKQGDYLTALRKTYKALLLFLDRIGLIRFREQRTNWEYLAEVRRKASSEFALRFQEVTNIFDQCFYARKLATANEFAIVRQFVEETRHQARLMLESESKRTQPKHVVGS